MENKFLTVGYITSTRGLKGVLRVKSTSYFAKERYKKGNLVYLYNEKDNTRISVIANTYTTDNKFDYVSFKDLEDINLVEKYIGYAIQVNRDENAHIEMDQVTVETGMDCEHGDTACKIPNLRIDDLDDEY